MRRTSIPLGLGDKGSKGKELEIPSMSVVKIQKSLSVTRDLYKIHLRCYLNTFTIAFYNSLKLGKLAEMNQLIP